MIRRAMQRVVIHIAVAIWLAYGIISVAEWAADRGRETYAETLARVREEVQSQSAPTDTLRIDKKMSPYTIYQRENWFIDTSYVDPWAYRTVSFPANADTMRIIIDGDTLYSTENIYRVLIQYEIARYLREREKP